MTRTRLTLLAAAIAALALGALATRAPSAHSDTPAPHQITTQGLGTVEVVPDTVGFTFGVQTNAKTASAALAANGETAQRVVAALKQAGIPAAKLRTQQVSLSQRRTDDGQTVLGYDATSSVSATLPSVDTAGAVIDAAVAAGADTVDGPSLAVSSERALERKALAAAVADARARAQALAAAAGVTLGAVVAVSESGTSSPVPFTAKADAGSSSVPVEPGTQEVQASVTVTFASS